MKTLVRNMTILVTPILFLVLINETTRPTITESPYVHKGTIAINSSIQSTKKCTWTCHNNTVYCKQHHVKLVQSHFKTTDPIYFGLIGILKSTGNYGLANIIILVVISPLFMFYLLTKSLHIQQRINTLRKKNGKNN